MSKCTFNRNDLNLDLQDRLQDTLDEIWGESDSKTKKSMFINMLKEIGEGYDIPSLTSLSEFIIDFVNDYAPDLHSIIPSNMTTYLAGNGSNIDDISEENPTKLDALDNPEDFNNKKNTTRTFITKNYGTATEVSDIMEMNAMYNIVNCFLVNRNTGKVIKSVHDLNEEVRNYQENLLQEVVGYLKDVYSKTPEASKTLEELSNLTMYKDGKYTGAVARINAIGKSYLHYSNFTSDDLRRALSRNRVSDKKFIKAYNSLVTLNNFDNILYLKLGDILKVNDNYPMYSTEDRYSLSGSGSHNMRHWGDKEKDIDMNEYVSDVTKLLIDTTPMYTWGSSTPINNTYLKSDAFNFIISKIKGLLDYDDIHNINLVFDDTFFLTYPQFDSLRSRLEGKSLYYLLNSLNDNYLLENCNVLFELFSDESFFNANRDTIFKNFRYTEKNILYSIKKGLFGNNKGSLYDVYLNNLDKENYYSYICQLLITNNPQNYMQYKINEDGELVRVTLRDNLNSQIRRRLEDEISASLSVVNPEFYSDKISKYNPTYNLYEFIDKFGNKNSEYRFKFSTQNIEITFNPKAKRSNAFSITKDGSPIKYFTEEDWNNLLPFFKDFLGSKFDPEHPLVNAYLSLKTQNGEIQYNSAVSDLLQLSTSIFFNSYFSHNLVSKNANYQTFSQRQQEVFGENNITSINRSAREINLILPDYIPVMDELASAYNMTTNSYTSGIVKDGNGNGLSGVTMSMLGGTYRGQWVRQCLMNTSATNMFSILDNPHLHKGMVVSREYKGNNISKKHIDFNMSESFYAAFISNFLGGIVGSGDAAFLPSVISDKSNLLHALENLNQMSSLGKSYSQLSVDEVKTIINAEIGGCYAKILDTIQNEWAALNDVIEANASLIFSNPVKFPILSSKGITKFNPFTDFKDVNDLYGNDARKALDECLHLYQEVAGDSLEIKDELSFQGNKTLSFNRTLISITNRFNPNYFKSKGYNPEDVFGKLTDNDSFWKIKEYELLTDLLDNDFSIETTNERGETIKSKEIVYLLKKSDWVKNSTKKVILAKYTNFGKTFNITKWSDLSSIGGYEENGVIYNWNTPGFSIQKFVEKRGGILEIHPDLLKFNVLDYLLSQEYVLTTVGVHANHPAKKATSNPDDLVEEAARHLAQHKRNVSYTAAKQLMMQGLVNGILPKYKIAVIQDAVSPTYNLMGDYDKGGAKQYDGCTFVSPETMYLENYSLGGAKAGVDKKPFVHFYKAETASGGIIKTAGFALTNFNISNSEFYQRMIKKMWGLKWDVPVDICKDFNGNSLMDSRYEDMYYKGTNGKFYIINSIINNGDGTYTINKSEVEPDGTIIRNLEPEITPLSGTLETESGITLYPVNTNFGLYQMFGGWNSYSKVKVNDNTYELQPSEVSIRNVVTAVNMVGNKLSDKVISQADVYQPLKHASIQYVVTGGAIKQGAANVNLPKAYYDDDPYLTMNFDTNDIGIQLDAEHSADESTLSIMTQVVNALPSRGYTTKQAQEVYEAMYALTETGIEDYLDGFREYFTTKDPTKFKDAIVTTIVKAIKNSSKNDGNLMQAIMDELIIASKEGKLITYNDVKGMIPFSSASMFNKLSSTISSTLTKMAIRLSFNGNLAVLNPSHNIWKLYGDRMYGSFNNKGEIQKLQELYDSKPLKTLSEIRLGRYYTITTEAGKYTKFIETPLDYWDLQAELSGKNFSIVENITAGRDLAAYNFTFEGVAPDGTSRMYNMWDLDVVKNIYNESDSAAKVLLKRTLQENLAAVSSGKHDVVTIGGEPIKVNKASLKIQPYELIMPKIYATRFGLKRGDDLHTIQSDPSFFLRRMISKERWDSKMDDKDFDIELKRLDGKHTYLIDKRFYKNTDLTPKEIETRWEGNKLYRVSYSGDKLYRLGSESDEVYTDTEGNEVIVTNNTQFYIDTFNYHTIRVSDSVASSEHINDILQSIRNSDKKAAKKLAKQLGTELSGDVILYLNKVYRTSIAKLQKDPNVKVEDHVIDSIRDAAFDIHTSFIKSLDVLAARIPAQSMQSFMPMRVVGFDETDTNSAYVNYFQFWLQGSDLDIDKVSLLGYSFDKSGKYIGWSPYFNLHSESTLKESETLPFPTGKELQLVETDDKSLTNWGTDFVGSGKLINFNGSKIIFLPEYDLNGELHSIDSLAKFLRMIKDNGGILYIPKGSSLPFNKIKDKIDKHNLFIKNSNNKEDMIKNFISTYMFNISGNPINLMQSQSSIDDSSKELNEIAAKSTEGQRSQHFTPGNVVNKYESMYDAQAGKKNVGIVASAIKVFDGLTQYYNTVLRGNDSFKQKELLFNRSICGNTYQLLANTYTDSPENIKDLVVLAALSSVNNDIDFKQNLSALMTAATDNAKNPILGKINAGPNMMGLYTYGTSIGIPMKDLAGVMMSSTARILSKLMDSNVFNGKQSISINNAIKYLEEGPSVKGLDPEFIGKLKSILNLEDSNDFVIGKVLQLKLTNSANGHELIKKLKSGILEIDNNVNKVPMYKFVEELDDYIRYIYTVRNDIITNQAGVQYLALDSIKELVQGAAEMGRLRGIYALNQGLPNKVAAKFGFIDKFESIFSDRIREFQESDMDRMIQVRGQAMSIKDALNSLRDFIQNPDDPYRISFREFMSNAEYRETLIDYYGALKHSFNVLDAAWSVLHYRGYLEVAHMDMESNYLMMSKYKMMKDLGPKVIKAGGFYSSADKNNVYKKLASFYDYTTRNAWMKSAEKKIIIPKGVTIVNNLGNSYVTKENTPILLGTPWGNTSFKMWMESTVIPELKLTDANDFIQSLVPIKLNRTLSGNASFTYTLPTNMMPKTGSDVDALNRYKRAFNELLTAPKYQNYPLVDLFFYYNLISYNNATSSNSLSTIFEDIIRTKSSPLINEYNKYISMLDTTSELKESVDYYLSDALLWCAPFTSTHFSNSRYVREYNPEDMSYHLYMMKEKRNDNEYDDDYNEMYDDFLNDEDNIIDQDDNYTRTFGPDTERYSLVENSPFESPWEIPEVSNPYKVRVNASTIVSLTSDSKLEYITYNGKEYTKEDLLPMIEELGGKASDLDIPYTTIIVDGKPVRTIDTVQLDGIFTLIFDNPC